MASLVSINRNNLMNFGGPKLVALQSGKEVPIWQETIRKERAAELGNPFVQAKLAAVMGPPPPDMSHTLRSHFPVLEQYVDATLTGKGISRYGSLSRTGTASPSASMSCTLFRPRSSPVLEGGRSHAPRVDRRGHPAAPEQNFVGGRSWTPTSSPWAEYSAKRPLGATFNASKTYG
eukprot:TRINITY_DN39315_c0_g1_i1.p1 TRINITY_DN39315_c0_g1~~TRINITY_DN39315_c0_g1_i1.p1  ORF type:complete len:202 (-),score=22.39 TRINITY_DN39315_c0_g1_i1:411-938(-)